MENQLPSKNRESSTSLLLQLPKKSLLLYSVLNLNLAVYQTTKMVLSKEDVNAPQIEYLTQKCLETYATLLKEITKVSKQATLKCADFFMSQTHEILKKSKVPKVVKELYVVHEMKAKSLQIEKLEINEKKFYVMEEVKRGGGAQKPVYEDDEDTQLLGKQIVEVRQVPGVTTCNIFFQGQK